MGNLHNMAKNHKKTVLSLFSVNYNASESLGKHQLDVAKMVLEQIKLDNY